MTWKNILKADAPLRDTKDLKRIEEKMKYTVEQYAKDLFESPQAQKEIDYHGKVELTPKEFVSVDFDILNKGKVIDIELTGIYTNPELFPEGKKYTTELTFRFKRSVIGGYNPTTQEFRNAREYIFETDNEEFTEKKANNYRQYFARFVGVYLDSSFNTETGSRKPYDMSSTEAADRA